MIKGIGTDICRISRIKLELSKKILSEKEMELFNSFSEETRKKQFLAGRFSAKEAILKALTGIKEKIYMRDLVILNDDMGKPYLAAPAFEGLKIWVSISHEAEYSTGQAVVEGV
jgi:holo-[acyl-carrier protein] synthase